MTRLEFCQIAATTHSAGPRLRKALRDPQAELLAAVDDGDAKAVMNAAVAWAEAERAADVERKGADPPPGSFLVEEN